jgi:hypothetical protein
VLDSCPISAASTVEEMPRSIIREASACRIAWEAKVTSYDAGRRSGTFPEKCNSASELVGKNHLDKPNLRLGK